MPSIANSIITELCQAIATHSSRSVFN